MAELKNSRGADGAAAEQDEGVAISSLESRCLFRRLHDCHTEVACLLRGVAPKNGSQVDAIRRALRAAEICIEEAEDIAAALVQEPTSSCLSKGRLS